MYTTFEILQIFKSCKTFEEVKKAAVILKYLCDLNVQSFQNFIQAQALQRIKEIT